MSLTTIKNHVVKIQAGASRHKVYTVTPSQLAALAKEVVELAEIVEKQGQEIQRLRRQQHIMSDPFCGQGP